MKALSDLARFYRHFSSVGPPREKLARIPIKSNGVDCYPSELREAIDAATIVVREFANDIGEDGESLDTLVTRVAVISPSLRGSFFFSKATAAARIRRAFPYMDDLGVQHAVKHLESRVNLHLTPVVSAAGRRNWVQEWD